MQNSFLGYKYRFFVAPGIIVHELSHAIVAKLTFHQVKKISLFDPKGGYVLHTKSKEPFTQVLISFAPIIGITLTFLLLTYLLQPSWIQTIADPNLHNIRAAWHKTSLTAWQTWLYFYLSISLATSLAPSSQDFKVATAGIIIIVLALLLVSISPAHSLLDGIIHQSFLVASFVLIFLSAALLLSLALYTITKIAKL